MRTFLRRQTSVALPNRPGALAEIGEALRESGVNIDALMLLDNVEQGVVRILGSDPAAARTALEFRGFHVIEAEVLEIDSANRVGVLAELARRLGEAGINIDYAYGTEGSGTDRMRFCLKVSDPRRAQEIIGALRLG